jgi:hypothetical protein
MLRLPPASFRGARCSEQIYFEQDDLPVDGGDDRLAVVAPALVFAGF